MGAALHADGVAFRLWAPNASVVAIAVGGMVNERVQVPVWQFWQGDILQSLGDGTWGGFVPGIGEGTNYIFYVVGAQGDLGGWKRDPFARELATKPQFPLSPCVIRDTASYPWQDGSWRPPAFSDLILYQLHVGSWWAQDAQRADARSLRAGTFLDAVCRIPYLADLGVNAVQLLPVQEDETAISMGYNGADLFSPEIVYCVEAADLAWRLPVINQILASQGSPPLTVADLEPGLNQLKCLIDIAHLHGIAVIFDQVYNHAFGHDWHSGFPALSLWFQDRQLPGDPNRSLYFTDQTWIGPIFAFWNDWVSQFLIDNSRLFLLEYHLDGFRYDEVSAISNHGGDLFAQRLTETVRATRPSAVQIAEYWNADRSRAIQPAPAGLGFDVELGDGLRDALRSLAIQSSFGLQAPLDLAPVAATLTSSDSEWWRFNNCLENQDLTYAPHENAARIVTLADPSDRRSWYARSRTRALTAILMTAPGIPTLFMGEEILEDKTWNDNRSPQSLIWWQGLDDPIDSSMRDFLKFTKDLIGFRRSQPALSSGGVRVTRAQNFDRVLTFHRWVPGAGEDLIVIASFDELPKADYVIGLPFGGPWQVLFNSDLHDQTPNSSSMWLGATVNAKGDPLDGFAYSAWVALPPNSVLVLGRG